MAIYATDRVEKGEKLWFFVVDAGGFDAHFFDVLRANGGSIVLANQAMSGVTYPWFSDAFHRGVVDTAQSGYLVAGEQYLLVVHELNWQDGGDPGSCLYHAFEVAQPLTDKVDLANARLAHVKNDVENVVWPRLKRLLALEGENIMIDSVVADAAGNPTSFRLRLFDDAASAAAATADLDDAVLPEPGEIVPWYNVTQTWTSRGVRDVHLSAADVDADDSPANEDTRTDHGDAPGNEAGWPEE